MQHLKNKEKFEVNRYPWYAARFWDGMRFSTWWNLLHENRFAVSPSRFPAACMTFALALLWALCGICVVVFMGLCDIFVSSVEVLA